MNMSSKVGSWAYTESKQIFIPENRIEFGKEPPNATLEPLRGFAFVQAVMLDDKCIGWVELPR